MARILLVEDSRVDALIARNLLEEATFNVELVDDGIRAIERIKQGSLDLVVTDLQLPNLDGLELVSVIREAALAVPVILVTGQGSEDIAVEALRRGASNYVSKKNLKEDLVPAIDEVLQIASAHRHQVRLQGCLAHALFSFELNNDLELIQPLISRLLRNLEEIQFCDGVELIRIGVSLREALLNAIYHGNLEIPSTIRQSSQRAFETIQQRIHQSPYCDRKVYVEANETPSRIVYTIQDEGAGFDVSAFDADFRSTDFNGFSGRGLSLIRAFMDAVDHSAGGRVIRMMKNRPSHA